METEIEKIDVENPKVEDFEKEEKRKAFADRVEDSVKKEKRALVVRETAMSVLSPITSILSPWVGKHFGWLGAFILARQGTALGSEMKNLQEMQDYRVIGNKLFMEFAREADATMPEVERDVKKASKLKSSIQQVANESVSYIRSKTAVVGGIAGIAIATLGSTVPTLLGATSLGIGGVLSSLATVGGITAASAVASSLMVLPLLRKRREMNSKGRQEHIKEWSNVEANKDASLANPALKNSTNSSGKMFQKLEDAMQKEVGVIQRVTKGMRRIASFISIPSLVLTAGVGIACYLTGIKSVSGIGTIVMSANVLNNSLKQILYSRTSLKETSDSMYDHYQKFSHNKIYELQYGNTLAPENSNAIQLKNICYQLRETDPKSPNLGHRLPQPLIQSDRTITFTPGINILGGASGSGKSTLYRLFRHADDTTLGSVSYGQMNNGEFQGVKTTDMPRNEPYKHIAFAFQDIENDGQTALEIIQQGNPKLAEKHIAAAAELIDLPLYQETEEGIKPKMFDSMSGGEKKRVLFLQALLSPKRILVFDEPTSGVNEETADKMLALLNNDMVVVDGVPQKRTIIYTTHHADELRKFDLNNVVQAVDMAPISDEKKIASFIQEFGVGAHRLPTEMTSIKFRTGDEGKQDMEDYINMVRSRDPSDKKEALRQQQNAWLSIGIAIGATMSRNQEQEYTQQATQTQTEQMTQGINGRLTGLQPETTPAKKELDTRLLQQISGKNDTK